MASCPYKAAKGEQGSADCTPQKWSAPGNSWFLHYSLPKKTNILIGIFMYECQTIAPDVIRPVWPWLGFSDEIHTLKRSLAITSKPV
jgi:hypothetical protein